jgi:zinc transport system substrate-binding protein
MNKKTIIGVIALIVVVIGGIYAYSQRSTQTASQNIRTDRLQLTASFYPLAFLTERIGGERVEVATLTPAGAEPHIYELTAGDIVKIQRSKLLILNGNFEPWAAKIAENVKGSGVIILKTAEGLATQEAVLGDDDAEDVGSHVSDPHIWLDPTLFRKEADRIAQTLVQIDPAHKDYYALRLRELTSELRALDEDFRSGLNTCERREFVTSHAAFGYLASRYGLIQKPIAGISPEIEPSARAMADISDYVRIQGIPVVFFETMVSPRLSETIARETGAMTLVLDPIEGISDDDKQKGKNYLTVMRDNLAHLQTALGCTK